MFTDRNYERAPRNLAVPCRYALGSVPCCVIKEDITRPGEHVNREAICRQDVRNRFRSMKPKPQRIDSVRAVGAVRKMQPGSESRSVMGTMSKKVIKLRGLIHLLWCVYVPSDDGYVVEVCRSFEELVQED